MINRKIIYSIFHDDNAVFKDYSNALVDFYRDSASVTLNKDEDYLYIGYYKPFNGIYFEISTVNTNANTFLAQYSNGSTWNALTMFDSSLGFTRSGLMQWDKSIETWMSQTVNSLEKFWIRLRPSATHSATTILGANVVFSDDIDLQREYFNIADFKGTRTSFINEHVSARDEIVQIFRNKGLIKNNYDEYDPQPMDYLSTLSSGKVLLTPMDLHDVEEIRLASCYLTLAKIFRNASDSPDGHLIVKANYYEAAANSLITNVAVSYDKNDDGLIAETDKQIKVYSARLHK